MKTYFLIIGASLVLTLGVVCLVGYRMSKPDSSAQQQNVPPVQKQNVDKKLVSETSAHLPVKETFGPVSTMPRAGKEWTHRKPPIANQQAITPWQRSSST